MQLDHTFANELTSLCSEVKPNKLHNAHLAAYNHELARDLNLSPKWQQQSYLFAALFEPQGKLQSQSVAQKYGGHQFGHWNPDLGDGRGLLLAEVIDPQQKRWDLHLKGAGPTPYSRFADGLAVLRSTIREYLASEALHHLGIPSSRALCLITSEQAVYREKQENAAQLIRVCQSHIRFGHFEYFYHSQQPQKLQQLFDYCFKYHFPDCQQSPSPYLAMFEKIVLDTAILMAKWQAYGFNHGVMNTDNMSIHGITFDFGPYAFLDDFNPQFICNHSDPQGRYAFDRQPSIGLWNLHALAQAFTPYLDVTQLQQVLEQYEPCFLREYAQLMQQKLGLVNQVEYAQINAKLVNSWCDILVAEKKDFSFSFRQLCDFDLHSNNQALADHFINQERFNGWAKSYTQALKEQNLEQSYRQSLMRQVNPSVILRNYLAQQVIEQAENQDFSLFEQYLEVLHTPFADSSLHQKFAALPPDWGKELEISCSS
ncbi:protein adenylyltransferase SelO [Paraglaciecola aestuariivivens]